jgi:hypothetical protein
VRLHAREVKDSGCMGDAQAEWAKKGREVAHWGKKGSEPVGQLGLNVEEG